MFFFAAKSAARAPDYKPWAETGGIQQRFLSSPSLFDPPCRPVGLSCDLWTSQRGLPKIVYTAAARTFVAATP